jgi:hypothetical protein
VEGGGLHKAVAKVIEMSEEVKKRIDAIWDKLNL